MIVFVNRLRATLVLCLAVAAGAAYAQTFGTYYAYSPPCLAGAVQSGNECIGTTAPAVPPSPIVTGPTGTITTGTPAITGTGENGDTLTVSIDGVAQGSVTVASGAWSLTPAMLTNASHTVTAVQVNPAGVASSVSAALTFTVAVNVAAGTTYQFAASGSDSNDCKTAPCRTLAKASSLHYVRDDAIRFHSGDSFSGQLVLDWTPGSGNVVSALDHPITVDVYGGTAPATINASGTSGAATSTIRLEAPNGITWRNVNVTGNGGGIARGFSFENHMSVLAPGAVDIGNITTVGFWDGTDANFGGHAFFQGYPGAGIGSITMHDWKCHGASGVTSYDDYCFTGYGNGENLLRGTIYNLAGYNLGGHPGVYNGQGGGCVQFNGVASAWLHHSVCHDVAANQQSCGGPFAFWTSNVAVALFEYVEAYNVQATVGTAGCDRGGVDFDINTGDGTLRKSFIHDTEGPGFLAYDSGNLNWHVYDNVFVNTAQRIGTSITWQFAQSTSRGQLFSNTIYGAPGVYAIGTQQSQGCPASLQVFDNAVYAIGDSNGYNHFVYTDWAGSCPGVSFAANGYWGTGWRHLWRNDGAVNNVQTTLAGWQGIIPGGDAGALLGDPLFAGPVNDGSHCTSETSPAYGYAPPCPSGYQLQAASPYRGVGINPWAPSVSASDYWGTPQFNIGAY